MAVVTDYNFEMPISLLRFLGACVFGNAKTHYSGLNESDRAELEDQVKCFGMDTWFYRFLHDVLPEEKRTEYQKTYWARQMKAMQGHQELKRLYRTFAARGLRFAPIKGADLAYRLYPDAALRTFCDWDIWFHPDDCESALEALAEDGWQIPELYQKCDYSLSGLDNFHHFPPHKRNSYLLEPHFSLSKFDDIDPVQLWEFTADDSEGEGYRVLSPELNLLMLTQHASSQLFLHAHIPQMLTDAATVIQKEKVDFAKLRRMSNAWHLPYPGNLLAAFPEFFPHEILSQFDATPGKTSKYRKLFELRGKLGNSPSTAINANKHDDSKEFAKNVSKALLRLSPDAIRNIYHLPKHGAWGNVVWSYVCRGWTRSGRTIHGIAQKKELHDYIRIVKELDSLPVEESGFPQKTNDSISTYTEADNVSS